MYHPNEQDSGISLTRILLAVGLSIAFFAAYAYFFPQKPRSQSKPIENKVSAENITDNTEQLPVDSVNSHQNVQGSQVQANSSKPLKQTILTRVDSEKFEIEIDALGRIKQVYLKDEKFTRSEQTSLFALIGESLGFKSVKQEHDKLPLFGDSALHTMEMRFSDAGINQKAFNTSYTASAAYLKIENAPVELILTQNLDGVVVKKILTIYPNLHYDVKIELSNPNLEYYISNGMRPTADPDTYAFRGVMTRNAIDGILTRFEDDDVDREYANKKANDIRNSSFVASVDRYYTSLFYTRDPNGFFVVVNGDNARNPMPYVRYEGNTTFSGYIGPKFYQELKSIEPTLTDVVEYGRITFFAKPLFLLLEYLYSVCGNWGWAIVFLTIIVRIVLYPLTYKGMLSMQKLKDLAPKMKEIQTKYKGDSQKLQMHMMELYKKNGANPLGGCLPLLLQIPVFFAIYRVLHNAVELKSADWILWITDLSAIDPYFVLPVLMGVSMYISQKLTPSNFTDPLQEKIFKMLPLFFSLFFIIFPFPAGLVLYWTVNNIFSILQQLSINKIMEQKKLKDSLHKGKK